MRLNYGEVTRTRDQYNFKAMGVLNLTMMSYNPEESKRGRMPSDGM